MQAYIQRYDGRTVSAARAIDALEYTLEWARRFDGGDASIGILEMMNMITIGLATQKAVPPPAESEQVAA
jgi:hypothetical protein